MEDPESGSGPNTSANPTGSDPVVPAGWRRPSDLRLFELNPDHPDYPEEWRSEVQERARQQLAASPAVAGEIRAINASWPNKDQLMAELRVALLEAERRARIVGDDTLLRWVQEKFSAMTATFAAASLRLEPGLGIGHELVTDYLARAILPADIAAFFAPKSSPVSVMANADQRAVMVVLYPGEFVVKGHGVGRKEIAQHVGRFITEAQEIIDREHGRERKPGPKPNKERAIAVKALKDRGLTAVRICNELGLSYRDSEEARRIVRSWSSKADGADGGEAIG